MSLDRVIHEPARLRILMILSGLDECDFNFLKNTLSMTNGNLSAHVEKLDKAGFVTIHKEFQGKTPHTLYRMTAEGREALQTYWSSLDEIRSLSPEASSPSKKKKRSRS